MKRVHIKSHDTDIYTSNTTAHIFLLYMPVTVHECHSDNTTTPVPPPVLQADKCQTKNCRKKFGSHQTTSSTCF